MQGRGFSPNHHRPPTPFAPRNNPFSTPSPNFLRPRGSPQWQQHVRYSTPKPQWALDSPPTTSSPSPHGSAQSGSFSDGTSNTDYISLNSSSSSIGEATRWRGSPYRYSPGSSPGRFRNSGRSWRGNPRPRYSTDSDSNPGHSSDIRAYASPRCLEDPWKELSTQRTNNTPEAEKDI